MAHGRNCARRTTKATKKINRLNHGSKRAMSGKAAAAGPDGEAVRSTMRNLLRGTNPRIQGMRPRSTIRQSDTYNAIVNEYRQNMNNDPVEAWKNHSTAAEIVQSFSATTANANTLYQSGWAPVRSQQRAVDNVAKRVGMDLTTNINENSLDDMLLFSNKHAANNNTNSIFGDDASFNDIFGGGDAPVSKPQKKHMKKASMFNDPSIDHDLQLALNASLNFANPLDMRAAEEATIVTAGGAGGKKKKAKHISTDADGEVEIEYFDAKTQQHVKAKRSARFSGQNGWEQADDVLDGEQADIIGGSIHGSKKFKTSAFATNNNSDAAAGVDEDAGAGAGSRKGKKGGQGDNNNAFGNGGDDDNNNNNNNNNRTKTRQFDDGSNPGEAFDNQESLGSGDVSAGVTALKKKAKKAKKAKKLRINWGDDDATAGAAGAFGGAGALAALLAGVEAISAAGMYTNMWDMLAEPVMLKDDVQDAPQDANALENQGDEEAEEGRRPAGRK